MKKIYAKPATKVVEIEPTEFIAMSNEPQLKASALNDEWDYD